MKKILKTVKKNYIKIFILFIGLSFGQIIKCNPFDYICFSWCNPAICFWCSKEQLAKNYVDYAVELFYEGRDEEAKKILDEAAKIDAKTAAKAAASKIPEMFSRLADRGVDWIFNRNKKKEDL